MKLTNLTAAVVAGLAGCTASAQAAVSLNPLGVGQVLLFPYYTVNGDNDTYFSVVNTTNRGKAVRVRFLEGRNSKDVLELNVYLSGFDVWTSAVFSLDANGPANLLTRDRSRTVPDLVTNSVLGTLPDGTHYVPFRNFVYAVTSPDSGGTALTRTREGHLEVIEMGVLNGGAAPTQIEDDITHRSASGTPNSGVPTNCAQAINNWLSTGGAWGDSSTGNRQLDISLPSGGLYGEAVIINPFNGTLHAYAADAVDGFYGGSAAPGGLHFAPGSERPSLADASNGGSTIDSMVTTASGESIRSTWNTGTLPDAVSAVLMQDAIYNEFNTETALGAQSEWVITFPTKRYYVDSNGPAHSPFTQPFRPEGQACEVISPGFWDREELDVSIDPACHPDNTFEPPPPIPPDCLTRNRLCYSAQVETMNQPQIASAGRSSIFGAGYAANLTIRGGLANRMADKGEIRIRFDNPDVAGAQNKMTSNDGDIYQGLPVIGFWSANYVNSAAQPGLLANYSGAVHHRGTRNIVGS